MELGFNDFDGVKSILGTLERVGSENLDFFRPKCQMALALSVNISGPKKVLIFGAHSFQ
jgi:hypothetical protein